MAEQVGSIFYDVTLDTRRMVEGSRQVQRENERTASSFNAVDLALTKIARAVGIYAAAMALVKAAQTADDVRLLGARIEVAAGSTERGAAALDELQKISVRTRTELAANATVFQRLNSSILQMGGTQADTLRITELLGKAITVSGASAQEKTSAMIQFGQALGSGKLAGDELRSLLENAPYLMQQLADGLGVPIGALKGLGEQGKLTADVVTNALQKAAAKIEADFKRMPETLAGSLNVASDAAARTVEAIDTVIGVSAAMTGVTAGAGKALDMVAQALRDSTSEADRLGRNDSVKSWAESTTTVLTYVIDAADFVGRSFRQMGTAIGGVAAAAGAAARGEFSQAREILSLMKDDILTIGNAKFAGEKMREMLRMGRMEDRGFTPAVAPSRLRPPPGAGGDASKFDAEGYLAKLAEQTATGLERINLIEAEALRKAAELRKAGKITQAEEAQAITLIETKAAQERLEIQLQFAEDRRQAIEQGGKDEAAAREQALQRLRTVEDAVVGGNEVQRLELELQRKSALLAQYALEDQENAQFYAEARVALERQTAARIADIEQRQQSDRLAAQSQILSAYGSLFGSLSELAKQHEGEQSGIYRAMFAVSKAFAIADSIIKIQQGVANALSLPYPANIAAAASTAASAAGLISTIQGTSFGGGRLYGGATSANTMYRVNESGRPEMFTAANGAQYMLPTTNGSVTPADQVGGGNWTFIVQNMAPGVEVSQPSVDQQTKTVRMSVQAVAAQISEKRGEVWSALAQSTNVKGVL